MQELTIANFCGLCGNALGGRWVEVRPAGQPQARPLRVCRFCAASDACSACGLPVGTTGEWIEPDRILCKHCAGQAVGTAQHAFQLYTWVRQTLERKLGFSLRAAPRFSLLSTLELRALACAAGQTHSTAPSVQGLFARNGPETVLAVLYGLPQTQFIEVCAHELGHAWQQQICPTLQDAELCEGFAQWVAYKLLELLPAPLAVARMVQRSDIYGNGLQRMLALEARTGTRGVPDALCQTASGRVS